ncbi:hypothetical protein BH18ACT6_BH18ACT6_19640 [soil metagenome]
MVCCQAAVVTGEGLVATVVEAEEGGVELDELDGVDGLVENGELVDDAVPVVVVVVGWRVVQIRIEVELEVGDAAMTPVSGWSFTSEPAALTAT